MSKHENRDNPEHARASGLSRREAIHVGIGAVVGAAAALTGRASSVSAQQVAPTPPPATDPRFPMPPTWKRELRQLGPNVYAWAQGGGVGISAAGVSNAGLIVGEDYMMAIDGLQGPPAAKAFIADAKRVGGGKEIGRLIDTHHHGDHVNGNQFFTHAEIMSHPYCREECLKAAPNAPKMWTPTPGTNEVAEERHLAVPTVTFKDDMTYFIGGTEVQLRVTGPAHTWGDVVVYLPKEKVLFAGDVGFFWVAPYANNSYITKWLAVCDTIKGWDVDVIVPGHGPIGGKKELDEMANYFRVLGVEARKRKDARMTAGAAAAEIRLGRFDNWIGPERLIMDVVRWYQEWDGTLTPDYNTALVREATLEYNAIKAKKGAAIIPWSRMEAFAADV